jgi:amidase
LLGAVIETNPQAIGIAALRDAERRRGIVRGPLHGIPVLVKDNIASDDRMETTVGQ